MIDARHIGTVYPAEALVLEPGRVRFFAKAIGETDPVYFDETAARAAGHKALPAPATFLFAAKLDSDLLLRILLSLGIDVTRVLHAEQEFIYEGIAYAGDSVAVETTVSDIYSKKGGALDFVVLDSVARSSKETVVARLRSVIAVRN